MKSSFDQQLKVGQRVKVLRAIWRDDAGDGNEKVGMLCTVVALPEGKKSEFNSPFYRKVWVGEKTRCYRILLDDGTYGYARKKWLCD
jgi:hypothetical protein